MQGMIQSSVVPRASETSLLGLVFFFFVTRGTALIMFILFISVSSLYWNDIITAPQTVIFTLVKPVGSTALLKCV
ncbi:UNVERIFIED_CONTAM: hypothetical protein FKN15_027596 [Acipenser sinensis]